MSVLKTIEKDKVKFLMDIDYHNVLGRLKFLLEKDSHFFADVLVRKKDVMWSVKDNLAYKPYCEANEEEKNDIKRIVEEQIKVFNNKIANDSLIGDYARKITTYPSDNYIFFTKSDGTCKIVLTGWGCSDIVGTKKQHEERKDVSSPDSSASNSGYITTSDNRPLIDSPMKPSTAQPRHQSGIREDGFYIDKIGIKHNKKDSEQRPSKMVLIRSIVLILLASVVALITPLFLTGAVNRFVANLTNQWYLSGASRVIITILVAVITYSVAYVLIRFTTLGKSIVFNVVCFVLTFIWSILMGFLWMPG